MFDNIDDNKVYTINQVVRITGMSRCWVHRAISQGKVNEAFPGSCKKTVRLDSEGLEIDGSEMWTITGKAVNSFFGRGGGFNKREDGRARMILHVTPAELAKIQTLMSQGEISGIVSKQKQVKKHKK